MADRPYVRVYYEIVDDEKFANVYGDDKALATWLRLLLSADASYPASAPVPRWASSKTLKTLELSGLIQVRGHHFTVSGLAAERERRKQAALSGGLARGKQLQSGRSANGDRPVSLSDPSLAEPSHADAPAYAREGLAYIDQETGRLWEESCGKSPLGSGDYAANLLDDLCSRQGAERVREAIIEARHTFQRMPAPQQLVTAVRNMLEPLPVAGKPNDDSAEREAIRHQRAVENTLRRNHEMGAHADDPSLGCPACRERVTA
jgi:hypothetical protein